MSGGGFVRTKASWLTAFDHSISLRVAEASESYTVLHRGSVILAHAGDGLVWMIIGLAIFVLGTPNGKQNLYQIAISVFLTALLVTAVKFGVRRKRPQGPKSAQWSSLPKYDVYSLPSGHAARAACIAAGIFAAYPSVRVPVAIWAIGVCWARVAVAAHYLFDVLIGILIGVLATTLVARLWPHLIPYIQVHL